MYILAARSLLTTLSCCGMIFEMPMADPNAWFIAWKKRIPVRSWMLVWSRAIRRYTTPKSSEKNVCMTYLMVSVAVSLVCSLHVLASRSLNGIQNLLASFEFCSASARPLDVKPITKPLALPAPAGALSTSLMIGTSSRATPFASFSMRSIVDSVSLGVR